MNTILITGTSQGLGKQLAEHYLTLGWRVAGCSRGAAALAHSEYRHFSLDIAEEKAVCGMFGAIRREWKRLDALVNNAGIAGMNHALLTPAVAVERLLHTNVIGLFVCCREAAKLMQAQGTGRIVNFTSVAVPLHLEGEAAYAASKAAVEELTRILAREFAPLGATVNAVGPGPMATGLTQGVPPEKLQALAGRLAIKRAPEFADLANVVDFFLRPESALVTGQIVYLGGP